VGDSYGTNNSAGTGNETGTPDASIDVRTMGVSATNVNFGVQRLPNSDSYLSSINHPGVNQLITLNGGVNPPVLSGSDPEDCVSGCVLTTHGVTIDQVPTNAELYYNGSLVTDGYTIASFNPNLFTLRITAATVGDTTVTFRYSYVDAAIMKDPTPATYTLVWLFPLPATGLTASATLSDNQATIKWKTLSEQNTSHFIVERSLDNVNFTQAGNNVSAAGNSTDQRNYQLLDNIGSLMQSPVIFYRVKLVDLDGKSKYSNTVAVRLSAKPQVSAWPNPFQSSITINITTERSTTIHVRLTDVNGKVLRQTTKAVSKGVTQISMNDLGNLPGGIYLLEAIDERAGLTTVNKFLKN